MEISFALRYPLYGPAFRDGYPHVLRYSLTWSPARTRGIARRRSPTASEHPGRHGLFGFSSGGFTGCRGSEGESHRERLGPSSPAQDQVEHPVRHGFLVLIARTGRALPARRRGAADGPGDLIGRHIRMIGPGGGTSPFRVKITRLSDRRSGHPSWGRTCAGWARTRAYTLLCARELFGLAGVHPPTEEGNPLVRPRLIAWHRAVFQPSQDCVGMLRYIVTLPKIELRNVQH